LALIKPDAYAYLGKIINMIEEEGFTINNVKMVKLSEQEAQRFYS
jgi:nucleoside diphosphate kinase